MPIRLSVNRLMNKAVLRAKALHSGHPILAHLPDVWHKSELNITAPFQFKERKTVDAHDPIRVIHELVHKQCQETNDVLADVAAPGWRLLDRFPRRVKVETRAPAKPKKTGRSEATREEPSKAWTEWFEKFERNLDFALNDRMGIVVFSDGSQAPARKENQEKGDVQTGAAFVCRWWGIDSANDDDAQPVEEEISVPCGQVTPFDAEMIALRLGIVKACQQATADRQWYKRIYVYADNKAAVEAILHPTPGPAQLQSVLASQHARRFLEGNGQSEIRLRWCPGHLDIALNEQVDKCAKEGGKKAQPSYTSFAYARQVGALRSEANWRSDYMSDAKYRGHSWFAPSKEGVRIFNRWENREITVPDYRFGDWRKEISRKAKTNFFILNLGRSNKSMARYGRFWAGHFPHGAFRERFNLGGETQCTYCMLFDPDWKDNNTLETRDHILYHCKGWGRMFDTSTAGSKRVVPNPSIKHRLMFDFEYWEEAMNSCPRESHEFYDLGCTAPDRRQLGDTQDDGPYWEAWKPVDEKNKERVFYRDWVNVGWFLRLNPLAGTFTWTSLAAEAVEEAKAGLTKDTGKALYRAFVYTRGRRLGRQKYVRDQEQAARERQRAKTGAEQDWERHQFPKPNELEMGFTQWYARTVADHYMTKFNDPEGWSKVWIELGGSGYTPAPRMKLVRIRGEDRTWKYVSRFEGEQWLGDPRDYESLADSVSIASNEGGGRARVAVADATWEEQEVV